MPTPGLASIAHTTPLQPPVVRSTRGVVLNLLLGYAPPLLALGAVAAVAASGPPMLAWAAAPAAAAAMLTAASAWWTATALRRAATVGPVAEPRPDPGAQACEVAEARAEIDHQVRNTLQVAASLVSLELRRASSASDRAALLRLQARLHSLSLVHRGSSALDPSGAVRLDLLTAEIAEHLFAEGATQVEAAVLQTALDPVSAPQERAAAFALYVNEALMNARDHLDPERFTGPVALSLHAIGEGGFVLSVTNPAGADTRSVPDDKALGARLMASCAAQLGATLSAGRAGDVYEARLVMPCQPRS